MKHDAAFFATTWSDERKISEKAFAKNRKRQAGYIFVNTFAI